MPQNINKKLSEIEKEFDKNFDIGTTFGADNKPYQYATMNVNGKCASAGNKDIKSFIRTALTDLIKSEIKELEGRRKKTWVYGGGGGIDTDHWCKRGVCFTIPGIKQIVSYGIKNDKWWAEYLFKWQVILPEKYKDDGHNQALQDLIAHKKLQLKELDTN